MAAVRWRSDFSKGVVVSNLERRGWEEAGEHDDEWDLYWASVGSIKQIFGSEAGIRLQQGQLVNHFPNHYELTRKDLMVKNIKRYQKQYKCDGGGGSNDSNDMDIIPVTFVLPQDYALFAEDYALFAEIKKWSGGSIPPALRASQDCYVVSRYIDSPLLIGGKKFDLRLYVVVTSYRPLQLGFGRFCSAKYTLEDSELDNDYVHLTNVAIQKLGDEYNERHGNKWTLANIRLYLEATRGIERTDKLFNDIEGVVLKSLKACQNIMINDRHCFELYGYDIIIDDNLKPWLVEVNASPSLSTTTQSDRLLKFKVINDVINLVSLPEWLDATDPSGAIPPEVHAQADYGQSRVAGRHRRLWGIPLVVRAQADYGQSSHLLQLPEWLDAADASGAIPPVVRAQADYGLSKGAREKVGSLHLIYDETNEHDRLGNIRMAARQAAVKDRSLRRPSSSR
eukprot:gene4161-14261_t